MKPVNNFRLLLCIGYICRRSGFPSNIAHIYGVKHHQQSWTFPITFREGQFDSIVKAGLSAKFSSLAWKRALVNLCMFTIISRTNLPLLVPRYLFQLYKQGASPNPILLGFTLKRCLSVSQCFKNINKTLTSTWKNMTGVILICLPNSWIIEIQDLTGNEFLSISPCCSENKKAMTIIVYKAAFVSEKRL